MASIPESPCPAQPTVESAPNSTVPSPSSTSEVQFVPFEYHHQPAFKQLNEEWISHYFVMEPTDYKALDDPQRYILDKGGQIWVGLLDGEVVGVCALIKMEELGYYELSKLAVSPKAQGKRIGWLICQKIISAAKELGASTLYLESNTILAPAITLYYKLGFKKLESRASAYARCNIQMELDLSPPEAQVPVCPP